MIEIDRKTVIIVGSVLIFIVMWIVFGSIHDDGNRNAGTQQQIESAQKNQQRITAGIEDATASADRITDADKRIEESAISLESKFRDADRVIGECEQILAGIRKRGEGKSDTH